MLRLPTRIALLPAVVQCVETAAGVSGMGREESLKLALAAEEIFAYLCQYVCRGEDVEIAYQNGRYYGRVQFRFAVPDLNLGGLNITSTLAGDGESGLENMGLMIASRSVERLNLVSEKNHYVRIVIEKEKAYPRAPAEILSPPDPADDVALKAPDAEGLKQFAIRVAQTQPEFMRPLFFDHPGMVVDMAAGGEYQALAAITAKGDVVGGVLSNVRTDRIVQLFGPYVFSSGAMETAKRLLEACIARMARTRAIGLISLYGLPAALAPFFEPLGALNYCRENGETFQRTSFYRLLHEDPGMAVWTHADLRSDLDREYKRLVLARDIKEVRDLGEARAGVSIFSAEMGRNIGEVVLRPLWPGADFADNVERHIRLFREEGICNIFFELDLGVSWHAALVPALLSNRFRFAMILPFAGQGDMAVFQYHAQKS